MSSCYKWHPAALSGVTTGFLLNLLMTSSVSSVWGWPEIHCSMKSVESCSVESALNSLAETSPVPTAGCNSLTTMLTKEVSLSCLSKHSNWDRRGKKLLTLFLLKSTHFSDEQITFWSHILYFTQFEVSSVCYYLMVHALLHRQS